MIGRIGGSSPLILLAFLIEGQAKLCATVSQGFRIPEQPQDGCEVLESHPEKHQESWLTNGTHRHAAHVLLGWSNSPARNSSEVGQRKNSAGQKLNCPLPKQDGSGWQCPGNGGQPLGASQIPLYDPNLPDVLCPLGRRGEALLGLPAVMQHRQLHLCFERSQGTARITPQKCGGKIGTFP